jgi:hypothetical protein
MQKLIEVLSADRLGRAIVVTVNATEIAGVVGVKADGAVSLGASRTKGLKRVNVDLTVWEGFFPVNRRKRNLSIALFDDSPD